MRYFSRYTEGILHSKVFYYRVFQMVFYGAFYKVVYRVLHKVLEKGQSMAFI